MADHTHDRDSRRESGRSGRGRGTRELPRDSRGRFISTRSSEGQRGDGGKARGSGR